MNAPIMPPPRPRELAALRDFCSAAQPLFVLTGAGVSTASGIPDYRDLDGSWKRPAPMTVQEFMGSELARQRYWARSMLGWAHMTAAQPNEAHRALAEFERRGELSLLVTQNVDGLHEKAGSRHVIDLHGRLDRVRCMACDSIFPREEMQAWMEAANPAWLHFEAEVAPDGDVYLEGVDFAEFRVPPCPRCGGILKPDVVYFGEGVPKERVETAIAALERSGGLLVAGSSLMVYSGYRFAVLAERRGIPIAAINRGHNRADALLDLKVEADVGATLTALLDAA